MRDLINIIESAQRTFRPPNLLYHGTSAPIEGSGFRPLSHFGSLKAALNRSRYIYGDCYIYVVKLETRFPLKIKDGKNWQHSSDKLNDILYYTVKAITADEREYIFDGGEIEMGNRIVSVLLKKGYDSLVYKNVHEDPGNLSWVNLTSDQVTIIGEPKILSMPECYELEKSLNENSQAKKPFGPIYHRSSTLDDLADFDLTKASRSAVLGPAIYATFGDSKQWNVPGTSTKVLSGYVKGRIIDLTKPLEPEDAERIGRLLGRNIDAIPLITLERRFGSVAAGLEAAGYSAAIHEGPGSAGKHIAVFNPSSIIREGSEFRRYIEIVENAFSESLRYGDTILAQEKI